MSVPLIRSLCLEIEHVHEFISLWFRGEVERSEVIFSERFRDRFSSDFENIQPLGVVLTRSDICSSIWSGYGTNPDFQITISDCRLCYVDSSSSVALVTYIEFQQGAKQTHPSDNRRISSALFDLSGGVGSLSWLHLHETALP